MFSVFLYGAWGRPNQYKAKVSHPGSFCLTGRDGGGKRSFSLVLEGVFFEKC